MAKKPVSNTFDFEGLCEAFGLKADLHKFMESNVDYFGETYAHVYNDAKRKGKTDKAAEKAAEKEERQLSDAAGQAYIYAAYSAIEKQAENHFDLNVEQKGSNKYTVSPRKDWKTSLKAIIETINGVGYFHFSSVRELLQSGPFTEREAVLSHLHYLKDYGEVYGEIRLQREFETNLESALRHL
jgi:hypothetical protein